MKKIIPILVVFMILTISFSGCIFTDETDSRTLGYMMSHYKNFSFQNAEEGENVSRLDQVNSAKYIKSRNLTKVWMESYTNQSILFKGDLTSNYYIQPGDTISYNITVVEHNKIEYIKEFWEATE